jgi:hypothetical protein
LVVSDADGGAMYTMRFASACGRPRFALETEATGNAAALREGAQRLPWDVGEAVSRILAVLP